MFLGFKSGSKRHKDLASLYYRVQWTELCYWICLGFCRWISAGRHGGPMLAQLRYQGVPLKQKKHHSIRYDQMADKWFSTLSLAPGAVRSCLFRTSVPWREGTKASLQNLSLSISKTNYCRTWYMYTSLMVKTFFPLTKPVPGNLSHNSNGSSVVV